MMMVGNGGSAGSAPAAPGRLSAIYPVNSVMELTLSNSTTNNNSNNSTVLCGLIYCTDDISNTIVLKKSLVHTTLSSEITLVNASSVVTRKIIYDYNNNNNNTNNASGSSGDGGETSVSGKSNKMVPGKKDVINNDGAATNTMNDAEDTTNATATTTTNTNTILTEEEARVMAGVQHIDELKLPLPHVSAKLLEERERRALRLAEESLSHINQGASPTGQKIFDKLLKACNEVVWKGESIVVLKEIRVDPPYTAENCVLIKGGGGGGGGGGSGSVGGGSAAKGGGLDEHSLERVKKIVSAASSTTAN